MSIPVLHDDHVSGSRSWVSISAAIRFVHEVLVEAWAMANAAKRHYPDFE
jgi:hypothetical protein